MIKVTASVHAGLTGGCSLSDDAQMLLFKSSVPVFHLSGWRNAKKRGRGRYATTMLVRAVGQIWCLIKLSSQ